MTTRSSRSGRMGHNISRRRSREQSNDQKPCPIVSEQREWRQWTSGNPTRSGERHSVPAFVRMHNGSTKILLVGICVPWVPIPPLLFSSFLRQIRRGWGSLALSTTMQDIELLDGEGAESLAGHRLKTAFDDNITKQSIKR